MEKQQLLKEVEKYMMTTGEFLNSLEGSARKYRSKAIMSLLRNASMYELSKKDCSEVERNRRRFQRFLDAVLVDFINHLALERGGDRGEKPEHIRKKR